MRCASRETQFSLHDYRAFVQREGESIRRFKATQQASFEAERDRWRAAGQAEYLGDDAVPEPPADPTELPPGARAVATQVQGSVWSLLVAEGDSVAAGDTLLVVESMKMEFAVVAPCAGHVWRVACREGAGVTAGQDVVVLLTEDSLG